MSSVAVFVDWRTTINLSGSFDMSEQARSSGTDDLDGLKIARARGGLYNLGFIGEPQAFELIHFGKEGVYGPGEVKVEVIPWEAYCFVLTISDILLTLIAVSQYFRSSLVYFYV